MYVVFSKDELPKATGQYIFLEFKDSHDYCLLPDDKTDQVKIKIYPEKPAFVDQFKWLYQFSKVDLIPVFSSSMFKILI